MNLWKLKTRSGEIQDAVSALTGDSQVPESDGYRR